MLHRTRLHRVPGGASASFPGYPFDGVFVLNLDRRPDRWRGVLEQLRRARIDPARVTRVPGVDGATLPPVAQLVANGTLTATGAQRMVDVPVKDKLYGMDLTPGAVGCALGHRAIWRAVADGGLRCALILEDDVELHPRIARTFAERWQHMPSDWQLAYLGGVDLLRDGKPPRPFVASGVRRAFKGHRELTAYVVHAASAARCLELTQPLTWQIDTHICATCAFDAAAQDEYISDPLSYVLQPSLAIQVAKFGTDVQKQPDGAPALTDAARRMREFVGGETSVR
jgi:GR25 family glycosyltransferase involved in LPS biosynthesis